MEKYGTGIIELMKEHGLDEPEFKEKDISLL